MYLFPFTQICLFPLSPKILFPHVTRNNKSGFLSDTETAYPSRVLLHMLGLCCSSSQFLVFLQFSLLVFFLFFFLHYDFFVSCFQRLYSCEIFAGLDAVLKIKPFKIYFTIYSGKLEDIVCNSNSSIHDTCFRLTTCMFLLPHFLISTICFKTIMVTIKNIIITLVPFTTSVHIKRRIMTISQSEKKLFHKRNYIKLLLTCIQGVSFIRGAIFKKYFILTC